MAERRMFAKTIIDSDAFIDMPLSTQALYFHLSMRADDDGFINNPKKIQRMVGASDDDLKILVMKRYLLPFESGVVVVKHWKIHNYIQKDRYKPTVYTEEKAMLEVKENGSYTECIQDVSKLETQVRLGQDRIVKDSVEVLDVPDTNVGNTTTKRFTPPTLEQVVEYCRERNNTIDPQKFIDHYTANGWMVGRNKMKDWKATVRTWERSEFSKKGQPKFEERSYTREELDAHIRDPLAEMMEEL